MLSLVKILPTWGQTMCVSSDMDMGSTWKMICEMSTPKEGSETAHSTLVRDTVYLSDSCSATSITSLETVTCMLHQCSKSAILRLDRS